MAKLKPITMWTIGFLEDGVLKWGNYMTLANTRRDAIRSTFGWGDDWRDLYRRGARAIKVVVRQA